MQTTFPADQHAFRHEAFFYAGQEQFADGTTAFVRAGLEGGEAVLVVLEGAKNDVLRSALGADGDRVLFADMDDVGANPARIIPAWREFVATHGGPGRPVRGIGEPISAARAPAALVECQYHESLLNLAFAGTRGFELMCPYDLTALSPRVLIEARHSHPHVSVNGDARANADFRGLEAIAAPFADPLPAPPIQPEWRVFGPRGLGGLREFVRERALRVGLGQDRTSDLVLAVNELASNSVCYAGGGGNLRIWEDAGTLVCEVNDNGAFHDPLAGREAPGSDAAGGRGLWIANHACDLVQVRSFPHGTTVRLHMLGVARPEAVEAA